MCSGWVSEFQTFSTFILFIDNSGFFLFVSFYDFTFLYTEIRQGSKAPLLNLITEVTSRFHDFKWAGDWYLKMSFKTLENHQTDKSDIKR